MGEMIDTVKAHYSGDAGSNVADRVRTLLEMLDPGVISPERLAALDRFHVRGAEATAELANLAGVQTGWTVLDAGSGLGGPSRHLAEHYGCQVEGVDLTPAFVEVAKLLAERAGMAERLSCSVGDVTVLPTTMRYAHSNDGAKRRAVKRLDGNKTATIVTMPKKIAV